MPGSEPNITFELVDLARAAPGRTAIALSGRKVSYRQLDALVWRAAQHLHSHGVRAGDTLALVFSSEALLAVALLGLMRLGATGMTVPRSATAFQRDAWLEAARCRMLVCDDPGLRPPGIARLLLGGSDLDAVGRIAPGLMDERPQAPCLLAIGSGTTGRPKLIPLTHGQMRARCRLATATRTYTGDSRVLFLSHLEFPSIQTYLLSVLHLGATYCIRSGDLDGLADECLRQGVDVLCLSVFHAETLLRGLAPGSAPRFGFLNALRIAGSTVSPDLRARIGTRMTPNLHVGYGTNECLFISVATPPEVFDVPGTIGQPLPGVSVEVVDADHRPAPQGTIGQLRVRSPALFSGYLDDPEATQRALVDGWFHPGDLARALPDGALVHCGRSDQMMIVNGINIYPVEIEQCLAAHPAVTDVAVISLRHTVHQDVPVCAVSLSAGATVSGTELLAYARERLGFRAPSRVIVLERLPRNDLGKVIRADLWRSVAKALGLGID